MSGTTCCAGGCCRSAKNGGGPSMKVGRKGAMMLMLPMVVKMIGDMMEYF